MTKLSRGLGSVWHIYQKNTGKGIYDIIRTAHSHQSSKNLAKWHEQFKGAARGGMLAKRAREICLAKAEQYHAEDKMTTVDENGVRHCKMVYLRKYLGDQLDALARQTGRSKKQKSGQSPPPESEIPPGLFK